MVYEHQNARGADTNIFVKVSDFSLILRVLGLWFLNEMCSVDFGTYLEVFQHKLEFCYTEKNLYTKGMLYYLCPFMATLARLFLFSLTIPFVY